MIKRYKLLILCVLAITFIGGAWAINNLRSGSSSEIKIYDEPVLGTADSPAVLSIDNGSTESLYESEVFRAKFAFNAIAPHWEETNASESNRIVEVRVSDDGSDWSEWLELEISPGMKDDDPHPGRSFTETPLFIEGNHFQFKTKLTRASPDQQAPVIRDMKITYLDSRVPTSAKISAKMSELFSNKAMAAANSGPGVITRAQWGSPDPYGKSIQGDAHWTPTYAPVKQIFVHHTVNSNTSSDFSAVVRGIWQFHTYTRGWGDIGYNYLIDGNGKVYEGRFGGDNVTGGHTLGFNAGSMGVALIGCFQPGTDCSSLNGGNNFPSAPMINALSDVIAWKSTSYEIDPNTTQTFCGYSGTDCRSMWTVAGHRDIQQTSCPGDLTYDQLASIRQAAATKKTQGNWPYSAKQLSLSTIYLTESETNVTLSFKNTGTSAWSKTGFGRVILQTANPSNHVPDIAGSDWINSVTMSDLDQASVAPGGTGTFTFKVAGSGLRNKSILENVRLVSESNTEFHYYFTYRFQGPIYTWQMVSQTSSTGSFVIQPGTTAQFTLSAKNTGNTTWSNTTNPVRLATWAPSYRNSVFNPNDGSWPNQHRAANLTQASVAPGQTGTFVFTVKAPTASGFYIERFNLVAEGLAWFDDPWMEFNIHVGTFHKWQMVSQSSNKGFTLQPGESAQFTLNAKNTGNTTWSTTVNPVRLATWAPSYRTSKFNPNDGSWVNQYRAATLTDPDGSVAPGETGTFTFTVKAPSSPGFYVERFNLVAEGLAWFDDPWMEFNIQVGSYYKWQMVSQTSSTGSFSIPRNTSATFTLKARNTGNTTWSNTTNPVRLATWAPSYRNSVFNPNDGSWPNQHRAANLVESVVAPGEVGTFIFVVKSPPTTGLYVERFNLVMEGVAWLTDPWMEFDIVVN